MPETDRPETGRFLPVDGHVHGTVDRASILALRSCHLHEYGSEGSEDDGPCCVGIHPWFVREETLADDLARLGKIVRTGGPWAVGETGLDRVRGPALPVQIAAMRGQIALSEETGRPLVVHCVRTASDLLGLRREMRASRPWIWHGWNQGPEIARRVLESGSVPSFGVAILRETSKARYLLRSLPAGSFLLETDDSGLAIARIEEAAAGIRSMSVAHLREELHRTWNRLFPPERESSNL